MLSRQSYYPQLSAPISSLNDKIRNAGPIAKKSGAYNTEVNPIVIDSVLALTVNGHHSQAGPNKVKPN